MTHLMLVIRMLLKQEATFKGISPRATCMLLMSSTVLAAKCRNVVAIDLLDFCNLLKYHLTHGIL